MKFSKKLLATLLPIAATSGLVPALVSCNKGSAWDFSYGEIINCLYTTPTKEQGTYHSLNDIKNAVKNHVGIDSTPTVPSVNVLPKWEVDFNKQLMYYDLIASCSWLQPTQFKNPQSFLLQWDLKATTNKIILSYTNTDGAISVVNADSLEYVSGGTNEVYIKIDSLATKSYMFQNTKIGV